MINWFIGIILNAKCVDDDCEWDCIILNAKCVDDDCEWDWITWSMQVWRNHMSNLNLSC